MARYRCAACVTHTTLPDLAIRIPVHDFVYKLAEMCTKSFVVSGRTYFLDCIREVPGYDFPCQNPYGRYGFFRGVLHTIFRHGESVWTGFHTNHVSNGDFASSRAERFFAYKFGARNIDFPLEVLISVQIFKKRHSAGM